MLRDEETRVQMTSSVRGGRVEGELKCVGWPVWRWSSSEVERTGKTGRIVSR
jgi:hypothetical protein